MSVTKDRRQPLPRVAPNQPPDEHGMLSMFERALDRAFGRFDQQFQRLANILEVGLGELVDLQKRSIKKFDRLNATMSQIAKLSTPEA
jgi:hypothetical protein